MDSLIVFKFAADNITDDAAVVNGTAFLSGGVAGKIAADAVDYAFIVVVTVIKTAPPCPVVVLLSKEALRSLICPLF